jgi:hypothetical protein
MWESQEGNNEAIEDIGGKLGVTALFLQPLLLGTTSLYYGGFGIQATAIFVCIGLLASVPWFINAVRTTWRPPATIGCNGHLEWLFTKDIRKSAFGIFYWITMLGAWWLLPHEGPMYSLMAAASVLITIRFYPGEWGSLWCFLANLLPLTRIVVG